MTRCSAILNFAIIFLLFSACSTTPDRNRSTAEGAYLDAQDWEKEERYEEALLRYAEVRNRFPYSRFAIEAELRVADIHFKREAYIEAQGAYQLFRELHPKHPQVPYVTHRIGLSLYKQLPSTIDRDLSAADRALYYFELVTKLYPGTPFAIEAAQKTQEINSMLYQKELYIAEFYFIRDVFDSALLRYEGLIEMGPEPKYLTEALFGAGVSALETGDREKGQKYLAQLLQGYPDSKAAKKGRGALDKYGLR